MKNLTWCIRRHFATSSSLSDKRFIDHLPLLVRGGNGGKGNIKHGGQGGKGGSVFLKATAKKNVTLMRLEQTFSGETIIAGDGKNAEFARLLGAPGIDVIVEIPVGVTVSTNKGQVIADINEAGDKVRVAEGANGGGPTNHFKAKKAPMRRVILDLKLLADVGLVGFPNAGKSTLLTRLSNATPKIAAYPFTTLQPQLGVIYDEKDDLDAERRVTIADLPGLIEGASNNVGLGYEFLKHVERTKVLLYVVDVNGFKLHPQSNRFRSPFETVVLLAKELECYDESLLRRPALLCVNKVEDDDALSSSRRLVAQLNDWDAQVLEAFASAPELAPKRAPIFHDVHAISAQDGVNLKSVVDNLRILVHDGRGKKDEAEETIVVEMS